MTFGPYTTDIKRSWLNAADRDVDFDDDDGGDGDDNDKTFPNISDFPKNLLLLKCVLCFLC